MAACSFCENCPCDLASVCGDLRELVEEFPESTDTVCKAEDLLE